MTVTKDHAQMLATLAAVEAHTRALLAFDCTEDEVPDEVDVPDDYERGLHDAATGYMQILQDLSNASGGPR